MVFQRIAINQQIPEHNRTDLELRTAVHIDFILNERNVASVENVPSIRSHHVDGHLAALVTWRNRNRFSGSLM